MALHLEKCEACKEKLSQLERTKALVAQLPLQPAPNISFSKQLSPPRSGGGKWLLASCLTAAAVFLLAFSLQFHKPKVDEATGGYLQIHRQYEQQLAKNIEQLEEVEQP